LDRALADAGVDRHMAYVTNAVKHFKHEPRGKRRLHKRPDTGEVEACRWWLGHELRLIRPRLTVALGATALAALSGKAGALNAARGRTLQTLEGLPLRATYHPSYLLRLPDEDAKAHAFAAFVADLREAQALARTL
jgi:DNA polymerase